MAGYSDTRQLIIDTLMGRPAGTEIQPEDHQAFALALNDYIRNVELNSGNAFIGFAKADTVPIQSDNGQCFYISTVPPSTNIVYANFIDSEGNPISVTTPSGKMAFVTLIWNTRNWDSQITIIETNWSQVLEDNIASGAVTGPKIAPNSISTSKIIDGTIQSTDLNPNAFDETLSTPSKIAPADVVGSKLTELESDKVSYTHMEDVKNGYILLEDGIRLGGVNEGTSVHSAIYYKVKPSSKLKFITDYLVVIYEYDINKNYLRGSSWYSEKEYYLVVEDTKYVRIGYRDNSGLTRDNFKKETCFYFDVLNEDVSLISKNIVVNPYVINKYKSKVVLVDDGTFKTVSSRWTVIKYAVNNVAKIKVTSKQDDNKSAVAAFYTEDDIYIRDSSVSAKQVNKEVSYEIAVPENANYVLCSSADIEPIVETDNIGKVVNGLHLEISNQLQQLGGELHSLPVARLSQRFEYHYFMGNRRSIIPPQSIFDLNVAKRLGFNSIELNVQVTSDNVLIVMHGSGGKFAHEVVDLNGGYTYADTPISSVTYQWIQDNLRYSSFVPKYRTKIITLEEALKEAKRIGLYVTLYMATDYIYEECVRLLEKYQDMPSYGVYSLASGINLRGMTKGVITHYSVADTIEKIINECELIGAPYIHAMANEILVDDNGLKWSDDELSQIVEAVHGRGCYLACAASYLLEDIQQHLWKLGFDYAGSGWSVNPFDSGNILNTGFDLYANVPDWETDGIIEDYTVMLSDGNTITLKEQEYVFLGKGYLTLLFNGKVNIKLGEVNVDLTSDGSEITEVSSYYLDMSPNLKITSIGTTAIQSFTFKLSKC